MGGMSEAWGVGALVFGLVALSGCGLFHERVDGWALDRKASLIERDATSERTRAPLPFLSALELEEKTRPVSGVAMGVAPLLQHRLHDVEDAIQQEHLSFESAWPLRFPESNQAHAYVYRHGALGERPMILWIPGQSTDDFIFQGLTAYLSALVARGLDIVFFVPPYHLERTPHGFPSGDAFLATDFPDHVAAFGQALSDARTLIAWLRGQGVRRLGAIGSSLGGSLLARLSTWDEGFDFLTLIAPVIRWELLVFQPEMSPVRTQLSQSGLDVRTVLRAYRALDPSEERALVPAGRISIFYGEHDRVAPKVALFELAERWGIRDKRLRSYGSGHALLFLAPSLSREVLGLLDRDLCSYGWTCRGLMPWTRPPPAFPMCP